MAKSDRVAFTCNDQPVAVEVEPGESLLSVLRERLGLVSVKDGCAPQGQCGCCTVLIDGAPRVACVTAASRVEGRVVTTVDGLEADVRDRLVDAFVATGASQCGFCTPGIVVRASAVLGSGKGADRGAVDRALAAHLCRCTGWCTVQDAITAAAVGMPMTGRARNLDAAARRAELEGGTPQQVGAEVPLGAAGFADDDAPTGARVAVTASSDTHAETIEAGGIAWVVGASLLEARERAGKVQGRRTTIDEHPPIPLPPCPAGGVRLATSWVESAYLEPDASWCVPGGEPASPLANGGAFGGKVASPVSIAARALADRLGEPVRVLWSREDVARLGPKRPPMAASAVLDGATVRMVGAVAGEVASFTAPVDWPYRVYEQGEWSEVAVPGPPVSTAPRATGWAERALLLEGALTEGGVSRLELVSDDRAAAVLLDTCVGAPGGALAGARVRVDPATGALQRVDVRVAAGDPLDEVVLRSYCIGAAHMALGWVLSEGLAVDPETGEVLDLTIRSFGVIRAKDTPPIEITIVDDPGEPKPRGSDAVFAAVAAAAWNAVTAADGARPEQFPARATRAARRLRA
ncbi:MAG: 2Fe-2S iron-sulfur cluster binding domain-containing protein [Acidimicrobiia bacterium]|nr:2Fe-2S iron-sulfur cluster binding domain-containing protein [Acidimicrobiia bacterium]